MEPNLKLVGIVHIILALVHVVFPRYFNWRAELASLSLINRQLMYVHTFFVAFVVGLIGLLCVTSASLLIDTPLGRRVSAGLALFWGVRLLFQFSVYSPALWRGKRFETAVHIVFCLLWCWFTYSFGIIWLHRFTDPME